LAVPALCGYFCSSRIPGGKSRIESLLCDLFWYSLLRSAEFDTGMDDFDEKSWRLFFLELLATDPEEFDYGMRERLSSFKLMLSTF